MRIIQLSYERLPKKQARGGGDLGTYQTLCALCELGHEVHLVVCGAEREIEQAVLDQVQAVHWIEPVTPATLSPEGLSSRVFHHDSVNLRFPDAKGYQTRVQALAEQLGADLIWADTIFSLSVAPFAWPVVFGQYDLLHRLKEVRADTREQIDIRAILRSPNKKRAIRSALHRPDLMTVRKLRDVEFGLARRACHVQSVSQTEADLLNAEGAHATAIPVVGPTIDLSNRALSERPRIFLFGNSNTAQKSVRMHLWRDLWDELREVDGVEWHQLGAPPERPDPGWHWLEESFDKVHGYVDDLSEVLGYGDVCFVPYLHDTGYRAKFTVAAAHGTINMGYHQTFECAPEFTPGENCLAASDVGEMAEQLRRLAQDDPWRERLAAGSRALYEQSFTFESLVGRYKHVLDAAVKEHSARAARA